MIKSCDKHNGVFIYEGFGGCPLCEMQKELSRLEEVESAYVELMESEE